jgi:pyridoxal phosphate enzyme (YggS family)
MSATVDPVAVAAAVGRLNARLHELSPHRQVQLVAVTKGFGADAITAAVDAGCTAIGENYAQELAAKWAELGGGTALATRPEVHFIGQLQTNKVRSIASIVDVWETVDRAHLADEIAKRAPGAAVYVQVSSTAEEGKGGCRPEDVGPLVAHCHSLGLDVRGLMTVGPTSGDPDGADAAFATLARLADELGLPSRSMGMSGDYELAVAHGATHVRLGSALFGTRPRARAAIG